MTPTQPPTPPTHTHTPPPYLGGCEEDLSNERRGLLHRGHFYHRQTDRQTDGHRNSMTKSAQWADSVKTCCYPLEEIRGVRGPSFRPPGGHLSEVILLTKKASTFEKYFQSKRHNLRFYIVSPRKSISASPTL